MYQRQFVRGHCAGSAIVVRKRYGERGTRPSCSGAMHRGDCLSARQKTRRLTEATRPCSRL